MRDRNKTPRITAIVGFILLMIAYWVTGDIAQFNGAGFLFLAYLIMDNAGGK